MHHFHNKALGPVYDRLHVNFSPWAYVRWTLCTKSKNRYQIYLCYTLKLVKKHPIATYRQLFLDFTQKLALCNEILKFQEKLALCNEILKFQEKLAFNPPKGCSSSIVGTFQSQHHFTNKHHFYEHFQLYFTFIFKQIH